MQTDSEIARILNSLTAGQTVTVKYTVRGGYSFERWVDVTVYRVDNLIYGSAYSVDDNRSDVFIRTANGQNCIRINRGEWRVIAEVDSPFVK